MHNFIRLRPFSPLPAATENKYRALDELNALHQDIRQEAPRAGESLHGAFRNRLRSLNDQQMDALQCWYPDDGIHIRYRAPGARWKIFFLPLQDKRARVCCSSFYHMCSGTVNLATLLKVIFSPQHKTGDLMNKNGKPAISPRHDWLKTGSLLQNAPLRIWFYPQ